MPEMHSNKMIERVARAICRRSLIDRVGYKTNVAEEAAVLADKVDAQWHEHVFMARDALDAAMYDHG